MAKRCKLGHVYCREARMLWADVLEAYDKYSDSGFPRSSWSSVDKVIERYNYHRKKCSAGKMVNSLT